MIAKCERERNEETKVLDWIPLLKTKVLDWIKLLKTKVLDWMISSVMEKVNYHRSSEIDRK